MEHRLPEITMDQLRQATEKDVELGQIVRQKNEGTKSKESSKGPYGKIWGEIRERNGILLRNKLMVIPESLQSQAIALAHKGHMQADGTLRQLRESQWFRGMHAKVQTYVDLCNPGCASSNSHNHTPPLKLKPLPKEPWVKCAVDFKGPIGPK